MVFVVLMIPVFALIDLGPVLFNLSTANALSAKGARAAAIYLPNGISTCETDVLNSIGNVGLLMADWNVSTSSNCGLDPSDAIVPGEPVTVSIEVNYHPMFWGQWLGDPWTLVVSTTDQGR